MPVVTVKGELKEHATCIIQLDKSIYVSSRGEIVVINSRDNMKIYKDFKGRVCRLTWGSWGYEEEETFDISYFGDYIYSVLYQFGSRQECFFSYENGRLSQVSGAKGTFKVIWDSFNGVSRGEKL